MKLLFDQNLSPKLVDLLADLFPGSTHVLHEKLDCADDDQIWEHARTNGLIIVSKDIDYSNLNVLRGSPPKVIWLLMGNCTTLEVESALRAKFVEIENFERDSSTATLTVQ